MELHEHQQKALDNLSNGKILWGGVGSGKSRVAASYYIRNEAPKDVYVVTTARKRDSLDWNEEFSRVRVYRQSEVPPMVGRGTLAVYSWNQIDKLSDVTDAFFIFDEQRLVGAGKWSKVFLKIAKKNSWILLSATPGDTWLDYIPVFLANGFYKNRTEFRSEHVVYNHYAKFPKVDRYLGTGKLQRLRKSILVHMPYERHTTRHLVPVRTEYDTELFRKVVKDRWHVYENRPLRDVAELYSVMRRVANSDESKLAEVLTLTSIHPRLIVFYNFNYELEMLRSLAWTRPLYDDGSTKNERTEPWKNLSITGPTHAPITAEQNSACFGDSPIAFAAQNNQKSERHEKSLKRSSDQSLKISGSGSRSLSNDTSSARTTDAPPSNRPGKTGGRKALTGTTSTKDSRPSGSTEEHSSPNMSDTSINQGLESKRSEPWNQPKTPVDSGSNPTYESSSQTNNGSATSELVNASSKNSTSTETALPGSRKHDTTRFGSPSTEQAKKESSEIFKTSLTGGSTTSTLPSTGTTSARTGNTADTPGLSRNVSIAEWNGHKHEPIPDTESWVYLVQYTAGAEAWNCITTNAVAFFSLSYSYRLFEQAQGRIDRMNTPYEDLYYYILRSDSLIDQLIWKALSKKESFNEPKKGGFG